MITHTIKERQRRYRRKQKATMRESVYKKRLVWSDWNLETSDITRDMAIRAESFKPKLLFNVQSTFAGGTSHYVRSPKGTWAYFNCMTGGPIPYFGSDKTTVFSDAVVIPVLKDLWISKGVRLPKTLTEPERFRLGAAWMSVTPAEMISQRSGIRRAQGKVVVGGLGLGWFLDQVCSKDDVEEVIVVERNEELLDWYGYRLCRDQAKVREVICDDVYAVAERFPNHQLLLDIWPTYAGAYGAEGDERLAALRKIAGDRVWAWGMD